MEHIVDLHQLTSRAAREFVRCYGRPPHWIAAAPGRVNLIGEHTDYNDGVVLPMATDRYVVLAADRAVSSSIESTHTRLFSTALGQQCSFSLDSLDGPKKPHWSNYVQGVVAAFASKGSKPPSFDALIDSTVPLGGGLSSSAALEVATATLLEAMTGRILPPMDKIHLCQKVERDFVGVPCGIMDQFSSVMGRPDHLMLLDCRLAEAQWIALRDPGVTVLVINSNVKHELAGGEYAKRRHECETAADALGIASLRDGDMEALDNAQDRLEPALYRRARHVISEIQRTTATAKAIRSGNWLDVGQMMYASHQSLRDDYEVSCRELDLLVDLARQLGRDAGVIGSRLTGAGFGGCTVSLVRTDAVLSISQTIETRYHHETGITPNLFTTRPARGAHLVSP